MKNIKTKTILIYFIVLFFPSTLLAGNLGELLKRFGLNQNIPTKDQRSEVKQKWEEYKKGKEKGMLLYIYYHNLHKKIIKELDRKETKNLNKKTTKKSKKYRKYKKRLFVGEGSFSYTVAFLLEHPELAHYIVATELDSEKNLLDKHGDFKKNLRFCAR